MARRRKMDPERKAFINSLLEHYQPKDAQDIQDMLKDLFDEIAKQKIRDYEKAEEDQEPVKENHQERIEHYQKILLQKKNARTSGGMSVPDNDPEASEPKKEILGKKKSIVGRLRRHQAEIAAKEGNPVSKYLEMQLEREKKK